MSETKDLTVLAITKMHGGVCSAGIDSSGKWVRPIRKPDPGRWERSGLTDHCLLPVDFFHGGRSHLVNLGVSRICLTAPRPEPPHVEDWLLDSSRKPEFIRKLSEDEQVAFLATHADPDLKVLEPLQHRSLALIKPDEFSFLVRRNLSGDDVAVRTAFRIRQTSFSDAGCTDLRMRALGRTLIDHSSKDAFELTQEEFRRRGKDLTYLAVGLSRLYMNRHWLIVVGVHTVPELDVEIDYARL